MRATGERWLPWGVWLWLACVPASARAETTAFFYSAPVPRELFQVYDQVVVQPDQAPHPSNFSGEKGQPVAYVSVGEVQAASRAARDLRPNWVLARNPAWSTLVLDPRCADYRSYLLSRFDELWSRGYRRFFLDTLDSYRLGLHGEAADRAARSGWVNLIVALKARHPEVKLLLNRGFELLADVSKLVDGVVAESLFDGWDAQKNSYVRVSEDARNWLLSQLRSARDQYLLPVTVIDYRPRGERDAARVTAQRIAELGFEPWVTDGLVQSLGVGTLEVLPRRILVFTDTPARRSGDRDAFALLAPVIEHLGYVPVQRTLAEGLPPGRLSEQFAGLVTWFTAPEPLHGYAQWLLEQMQSGLHVAIFGNPGLAPDSPEAHALGLRWMAASSLEPTHVVRSDSMVGFEAAVPSRPFDGPLLALQSPGVGLHLELADASGRRGVAIATTEWGGLASSHVLALRGLEGSRAWVLDPFAFLSTALALPPIPEPDLTTENGRRIALFVIRASGLSWPARAPGSPATFRVLRDRILARYPWPHALDLAPLTGPAPSTEDLAAAHQLLERSQLSRAIEFEPGATSLRREHASLTELGPAARETGHGIELLGPIAWDLSYLAPDLDEAFPFARVRETLEYTERPRRLAPILLDYHGFLAASSGGLATLDALYRYVAAQEPYFLTLDQYRARVAAFRQQVVTRQLDGSLSYHDGETLGTLRIPPLFGTPDLQRSRGVVALRQIPQAEYSSFGPGTERVLVPGRDEAEWPHLTDSNARIIASSAAVGGAPGEGAGMNRIIERLDFELDGSLPVQVGFGGLGAGARCRLLAGQTLREGFADAAGDWRVTLPERPVGTLHLSCARAAGLARREPS